MFVLISDLFVCWWSLLVLVFGLGLDLGLMVLGNGPGTAIDLLILFWVFVSVLVVILVLFLDVVFGAVFLCILAFVLSLLRKKFGPVVLVLVSKTAVQIILFFNIYPLSLPFTIYRQKEPVTHYSHRK
jgi:hypothetical protein